MLDVETMKWLGSLGVGGVLAGLVFAFYRRDFLRERANGQSRDKLFIGLIERNAAASERLAGGIEKLAETLHHQEVARARDLTILVQAIREELRR